LEGRIHVDEEEIFRRNEEINLIKKGKNFTQNNFNNTVYNNLFEFLEYD